MAKDEQCDTGFCGIGRWAGTAEVYAGDGRFVGNGTDQRFARTVDEDGQVRIDLAFVGPLKFSGHYYIRPEGKSRSYLGPVNTGFAESVGEDAVDGNGYWPVTGLSHKLFLAMLPDKATQLHLSLMFRGEQLIYTIVSEAEMIVDDNPSKVPGLVSGIGYDLQDDPTAGRNEVLLHRPGTWTGNLTSYDGDLQLLDKTPFEEDIRGTDEALKVSLRGTLAGEDLDYCLKTNGWQAWSEMGTTVGSYNLSGGRALTGTLHHLDQELRVWRREIVTSDGTTKAVLHNWYRGGQRVGSQQGILHFYPANA